MYKPMLHEEFTGIDEKNEITPNSINDCKQQMMFL